MDAHGIDVWESKEAANVFHGFEQFAPVVAESMGIAKTSWHLHRIELEGRVKQVS
ncbi:MAG: hypothetical protein ACRDRP_02225 [Pseudonocardiaceae bacterium]